MVSRLVDGNIDIDKRKIVDSGSQHQRHLQETQHRLLSIHMDLAYHERDERTSSDKFRRSFAKRTDIMFQGSRRRT